MIKKKNAKLLYMFPSEHLNVTDLISIVNLNQYL